MAAAGGGGRATGVINFLRRSKTTSELSTQSEPTEPTVTKAHYGLLRDTVIRLTPSNYQCKLFCGGANCKYCNAASWPLEEQALTGLCSTWITDNILATARPTDISVQNNKIVQQFMKNGIISIVNLQHYGEHKYCGPSLQPCGFSYNPDDFMGRGIYYYNFGWPDFGVSSLPHMLDMVKVLSFSLNQGKTAIHCHAGLGRTGVLISCYLIWDQNLSPTDAIAFVRTKRSNSVQNQDQVSLVYQFADFLSPLRQVFHNEWKFCQHLANQQHILHGIEARVLKHIPKLVYVCCERLLELAEKNPSGKLLQRLAQMANGDEVFYDKILDRNTTTAGYGTLQQIRDLHSDKSFQEESPQSPDVPVKYPPLAVNNCVVSSTNTLSMEASPLWQEVLKSSLLRYAKRAVDESVQKYTIELRHVAECWEKLAQESSAAVLVATVGAWFRTLSEPTVNISVMLPPNDDAATEREMPKKTLQPCEKWTILYLCSVFGALCGDDRRLKSDTAVLFCDWLTWSRDEAAEAYFLSCLDTVAEPNV